MPAEKSISDAVKNYVKLHLGYILKLLQLNKEKTNTLKKNGQNTVYSGYL